MNRYSCLVVLLIIGLVALGGTAAGDAVCPPPPPPPPPPTITYNHFDLTCGLAGTKQVDPIMAPGQTMSAHNHWFYCMGGAALAGASTGPPATWVQSVSRQKAGGLTDPGWGPFTSTGSQYGWWPEGWVPTAFWNGAATTAAPITYTWQAPVGTHVIAPPFGELALVGSATATSPSANVNWTCGPGTPVNDHPTDCTGLGVVTLQLTFPDCWDGQGRTADANGVYSFDHPSGINPSHFTYSVNGACAAGQQQMAQLVSKQTFKLPEGTPLVNPINANGTIGLSFSSGAWYTAHGDYAEFSNHQLADDVDKCLNNGTPGSCPPSTVVGLHALDGHV